VAEPLTNKKLGKYRHNVSGKIVELKRHAYGVAEVSMDGHTHCMGVHTFDSQYTEEKEQSNAEGNQSI
jgi:hypothetical protein